MSEIPARDRYFVTVHFRCCNVVNRVYFRHGAVETEGRCPRCLGVIRFQIREDAQYEGRFFAAELDSHG